MDIDTLKNRVNDLESKYMFQENLLDGLNKVVAEQQDLLDQLLKVVTNLEKSGQDDGNPQEKPPHY